MSIYAIGDVQGCFDELQDLLVAIGFDRTRDELWFPGDLVNRGPQSLEVLRFVRGLDDRATTVLGNHDLHLIALAFGHAKPRADDTLGAVLSAPDSRGLINWLRHLPLLYLHGPHVMVHAGLPPQWSIEKAAALAREVEQALRGPRHEEFLSRLYGNKPRVWREDLRGNDRLRVIVNAMTRMRFCTPQGAMEFKAKGKTAKALSGYLPWFEVPGRRSTAATVVCGHWSMLGLHMAPGVIALDSGCVWGGSLSAVRLEDRRVFQISCRRRQPVNDSALSTK